ncbi:MAG: hypothetical protein WCV85_01890 [Patescibacteria group bacterium]
METKMITTGAAFRYGWETLKKDFWYFIGISVLYGVITNIPNSKGTRSGFSILGIFISAWLMGGLYRLLLDYKDGKKQEFSVLFTQLKHYWRILGGSILVGLIVIGGLILLIVPGIIWGLRYMFTIMLIVDKNMDVGTAMHASAEMTRGIKGKLFVFALACLGTMVLGVICLGVGVFVAMPVVWLAFVYLYRSLPNTNAVQVQEPTV